MSRFNQLIDQVAADKARGTDHSYTHEIPLLLTNIIG
jgi:hypothetical protein